MRVKRRLLWIAGILVLLLGAGYAALWLTKPGHRINKEGFDLIQKGMTEEKVEEILGVRAGYYSTRSELEPTKISTITAWQRESYKHWSSNDASIFVGLDERGLVDWKQYRVNLVEDENIWAKLRRWLRIN